MTIDKLDNILALGEGRLKHGKGANVAESRTKTRQVVVMAHLAMLGYALIIAGSFSFGALAAPHLPPAVLNVIRFLAATILMAGLFRFTRGPLRPPAAPWRFLLLGGLMAVYFVLMFVALRLTDPVSTGAVFTLIPFMAAVFGFFLLGQQTRPVLWGGLLIAGTGALWVIFQGDPGRLREFHIGAGEMIFFIGCACQALYAPLVKLLSRGESVFEYTVWTLAGCALCLAPFAVTQLAGTDWSGIGWVVWAAVAYLVVFATALSFFLLQYASMHLPSAKVFPYAYLTPSFVIVLEVILGHGLPSPSIAAGAALTVLGLVAILAAPD